MSWVGVYAEVGVGLYAEVGVGVYAEVEVEFGYILG